MKIWRPVQYASRVIPRHLWTFTWKWNMRRGTEDITVTCAQNLMLLRRIWMLTCDTTQVSTKNIFKWLNHFWDLFLEYCFETYLKLVRALAHTLTLTQTMCLIVFQSSQICQYINSVRINKLNNRYTFLRLIYYWNKCL